MNKERMRKAVAYMTTSPQVPTCHDFAAVMGFVSVPEEHSPVYDNLDEMAKLSVANYLLQTVRSRLPNQPHQDIIFTKFAALYFPQMVDKLIEAPPPPEGVSDDMILEMKLNNCYIEFMSAISHQPYFSKYMGSTLPVAQPGKEVMKIIAQRLVDVAPSWDNKILNTPDDRDPQYYKSATGTALQLLSTLMAVFIKEPKESPIKIPAETVAALLPWVKKWERRHSGEFLGMVSNRARELLEEKDDAVLNAQYVRRFLNRSWNACAKPGCESTSDLKACSKCQTVRYCCTDHQKAHWSAHKSYCYKTEY